ncbi:sulfite reductase subunit A [candidate division KSB1 bacterium]|nr:MAG: sulfite reductase subunit A [candidate division KSB1 bacterium]MCE7940803.1 sulfite reductase subunit A [Chlorobi bacterium CHB1]MDL1874189.1 sulfite reductase subunit A [Cytophagia bacterium CHB2]
MKIIERNALDALFEALQRRGFQEIIGPRVRDGAIVYDSLRSSRDLPQGVTDEQKKGAYRLQKRADPALFGYVVGPHSWKRFLHPPTLRLWQAQRTSEGFNIAPESDEVPLRAFLGVRACELHALAIQDKIFMGGSYVDPAYRTRREKIFIIAVNCGQAGGNCFCASMNTGPRATGGFDLALTEVVEGKRHYFIVETGSERGAGIVQEIPHQEASAEDLAKIDEVVARAAQQMKPKLNTEGIKELLYRNTDNPRWEEVAGRCLSCANCTMVCPTCFCATVEDVTDLTGEHAERWRKWDSCFTMDFSYIHGGSVRPSVKARYRQWLTHKLASWIDQFGVSGCVGCGRCITWCPVGIDLTEEVQAMRENESSNKAGKPR